MLGLGLTSFLDSTNKYYIKQFAIDTYNFSRPDSSSNRVLTGRHNSNSISCGIVVKYSESSATTPWAKKFIYSTDTAIYTSLVSGQYDTSGNAYLGFQVDSNVLSYRGGVVKYDTNGNVLWQKIIVKNASTSSGLFFSRIDVDSSGNSYISGNDFGQTGGPIVFKFNSSGVLQWQRGIRNVAGTFEESGRSAYARAVIDYQNNILFTGETAVSGEGGGVSQALVVKCDPSGNILWQRGLYNAYAGYVFWYGLSTDSSGNVYLTGYTFDATYGRVGIVAKYNSAGSLLWQRGIVANETRDVASDSSGNLYVLGSTNEYTENSQETFIVKYDSNGTVLWQRTIGSPGYTYSRHIDVVGDKIYIDGYGIGGSTNGIIAVLPTDGSLTGTYPLAGGQVTYRASGMGSYATSYSHSATGRSFDATPHTVSDATMTSEPFNIATKYNVNLQ